jgi:DNA helicase-2/ATP-dependent DNA helicase PcrA
MNDAERLSEAADEAAIQSQYSEGLIEKERRRRRNAALIVNNTWTADLATDPISAAELIGRVKLHGDNDVLDIPDFYIGTERFSGDDYEVYGWTAPVACSFYRKSTNHHDVCHDVEGVRVFAQHAGSLRDFQDERIDGADAPDLFPRRQLSVPRAPGRPTSSVPVAPTVDHVPVDAPGPTEPPATRPILVPPATSPVQTHAAPVEQKPPGPPLRAASLLRRQLAAPKEAALSAVLATLQSDQYEAITERASESQVLQGHPGTGKTIVAVHRAAYLLSPQEENEPPDAKARGEVLILGPTDEYVRHVSRALRKLIADGSRYRVSSLPAFLEELAGLTQTSVPTVTTSYQDVDPQLARLVDQALARAKQLEEGPPSASDVYASLVGFVKDPPGGVIDKEWFEYLRALPPTHADLTRARRRAHRGLMAYIGVRTARPPQFGHVIIDEAQDIHPIEWEVLARLGNAGGWTILGDLNQRRTDHTFSSWDRVAELIAIENSEGRAPVRVLERGYRSTGQIIQFANQLLPKEERALFSLQRDGDEPTIHRVTKVGEIYERALAEAVVLYDRATPGTTAIIAADFEAMRSLMPRHGWQTDQSGSFSWRSGERTVTVIPPERARGLEFDAVVVVEPSAFPERVGRQGVLYTALTRANRLLSVIHHRALPDRLKARSK